MAKLLLHVTAGTLFNIPAIFYLGEVTFTFIYYDKMGLIWYFEAIVNFEPIFECHNYEWSLYNCNAILYTVTTF